MSPFDIENIVVAEGDLSGWDARTMALVFEVVTACVEAEREACARIVDALAEKMDNNSLDCGCHHAVYELAANLRLRP